MSPRKITKEEFLNRCSWKHPHGRYDFSQAEYVNAHTKVKVICKEHGEFLISPNNLFKGVGCALCAKNKKLDLENYLLKAREVHGDKYDYSRTKSLYSLKDEIFVTCKKEGHGLFVIGALNHIRGSGCPKCKKEKQHNSFLKDAKKMHGNRYDYSKTVYTRVDEKATIICSKHGPFEQRMHHHLKGSGCPQCAHDRKRKWPKEKASVKRTKNDVDEYFEKLDSLKREMEQEQEKIKKKFEKKIVKLKEKTKAKLEKKE